MHPSQFSVTTCLAFLVTCAIAASPPVNVQAQGDQSTSSFVITLSDANMNELTSDGDLESNFDAAFRGRLSAIVVSSDGAADADAVDSGTSVEIVDDVAVISVDDDMLGKFRNNPVRIDVRGLEFSKIKLNYTGLTRTAAPPQDVAPAINPANRVFFITLNDNKVMEGNVDGLNNFDLDCKFGPVTIPMEHIAGIRFHADGEDQAVVVLTNGDAVTGKPTVKAVSLKTSWGQADIEPEYMDSLTTSRSAAFSREDNPDFGQRWVLRTAIPINNANQNRGLQYQNQNPNFGTPNRGFSNGFGG